MTLGFSCLCGQYSCTRLQSSVSCSVVALLKFLIISEQEGLYFLFYHVPCSRSYGRGGRSVVNSSLTLRSGLSELHSLGWPGLDLRMHAVWAFGPDMLGSGSRLLLLTCSC